MLACRDQVGRRQIERRFQCDQRELQYEPGVFARALPVLAPKESVRQRFRLHAIHQSPHPGVGVVLDVADR